jgi:hypothetical protein
VSATFGVVALLEGMRSEDATMLMVLHPGRPRRARWTVNRCCWTTG